MARVNGTRLREQRAAMGRQGGFAALDVGTNKVTCFIARPEAPAGRGDPDLRVVGIGHQVARGIKAGTVIDMGEAEEAIRAAVDSAERMAGTPIHRVLVGVASPTLESSHHRADLVIGERDLDGEDLARVLQMARASALSADATILHAIPANYTVDGNAGVRDPRGMFAGELSADVHVVTASHGPIRNLTMCVERCHLEIAGLVATPYAAALASLVEDEMELGATLIDMGAGTTSLAIVSGGRLQYVGVLPVGGNHVTNDIARGLSTPVSHAERMKTLYGSALVGSSDDREVILVPQVGEEESDAATQVPRSMLTGIIRPRVEEILEMVRDMVAESGYGRLAGRRVVLTGGAAQLNGMREIATRVLERQVRIGRPQGIAGLAEATGGPAFAVAAGLVAFPARAPFEAPRGDGMHGRLGWTARIDRLGRWIRANI